MAKQNPHTSYISLSTLFAFGLPLLLGACVGEDAADPDLASGLAFSPDPFFTEAGQAPDTWVGEDAELVASVPLEEEGEIRFLDLSPSASEPSIAVVVIEPDAPTSVLDVVQYQAASPLELFLVVAPSEPVPVELESDHLAHYAERGLSPEPRTLDPDVRPRYTVDQDPWGDGCTNEAGWEYGFDAWSANGTAGRAHLSFLYPNETDTAQSGGFGTYDYVWAGVCMGEYGISPTSVKMEHWNGSAYTYTSGTLGWAAAGYRYLYVNFTSNSVSRRVTVEDEGSDNEFLLSGAWRENTIGG